MCGNRIQGYRNSKRMAVNGMVERLCKEEEVGYNNNNNKNTVYLFHAISPNARST